MKRDKTMTKVLKTLCLWMVVAWTITASPILTFEATFTDTKTGLLQDYHKVTLTLIRNYQAKDNTEETLWTETKELKFRNGFMSFEYGHKQPLVPLEFNTKSMVFQIEIKGKSGKITIPLQNVTHAAISEITKKALSVETLKASNIIGELESKHISGNYKNITGVGNLKQPLIVKDTLYIQPDKNKIGIKTDSPEHSLSVNGDIKTTHALLFPDGTQLNSTQILHDGGGPINTTGSVIIKADTDNDKIGNFEIKIGNVKRVVLTPETLMGIDVKNPQQTFDINGSLLIHTTATQIPGTLRFQDTRFEGFNGQNWIKLNTKEIQGGGWLFNNQKKISFSETDVRFGIGKSEPRGLLDVNGSIYAQTFFGDFNGNGSNLKNLDLSQISGQANLSQGGTGTHLKEPNRLIIIHETGEKLTEFPPIKSGQILIGQNNATPTPGQLIITNGIHHNNPNNTIILNHTPLATHIQQTVHPTDFIQNINLDNFGHIQTIITQSISSIPQSKQNTHELLVSKTNSTINGPLSLKKNLLFKGSIAQISTLQNTPLLLPQETRLGIGIQNPLFSLDINGALKLGNSEHTIPGAIRYDTTHHRFSGRNTKGWISLDANSASGGGWTAKNNTLININSNQKVGIGTNTPEKKLHINGTLLGENDLRTSKKIIVENTIILNNNTISATALTGQWDLSNATIPKLNQLNATQVIANTLLETNTATFTKPLIIPQSLTLGSLTFKPNNIIGNINFNNSIMNNVQSLSVGDLVFSNNQIVGQTGIINISQTTNIDNTILLSNDTISTHPNKELNINSTANTSINKVHLNNKHLTKINTIQIDTSLTVNNTTTFNKPIHAQENLTIKYTPRLNLGIGQPRQFTEQVSIAGDVIIGNPTAYTSLLSPKADLVIEGNLIVKGDFIMKNNQFYTLTVTHKTKLATEKDAVLVGTKTTNSKAKFVLKGTGTTQQTKTTQWYSSNGTHLATMLDNGNFGLGTNKTPTALLHLGKSQSQSPPWVFSSSPPLTLPHKGNLNYTGTHLELTLEDLSTKKLVDSESETDLHQKSLTHSILQNPTIKNTLKFLNQKPTIQTHNSANLILSTQEKVGISTLAPKSTLDINGSLKLGPAQSRFILNGTIQYGNHTFRGFKKNTWKKLNFSDKDMPWSTTPTHIHSNLSIGILNTSPQSKLDVIGKVSANTLIGNGEQIYNLLPHSFKHPLPVNTGGTGQSTFPLHSILLGNGSGKIQTTQLKKGELLIGNGTDAPKPGHLIGQKNINIIDGNGTITIQHAPIQNASTIELDNNEAVAEINTNTYGHLNQIITKNLDTRYYSKSVSNTLYYPKTGGNLNGSLILTASTADIKTTSENPNLIIKLKPNGKIGIGVPNPKTLLDINGGIRIQEGVNIKGEIQYKNNRFEGYAQNNEWKKLDLNNLTHSLFTATEFIGNGAQITQLRPLSFNKTLSVKNGGTGQTSFDQNTFITGQNQSPLKSLTLDKNNVLLIGNNEGTPTIATINEGIGIKIIHTPQNISIQNKTPENLNSSKIGNINLNPHAILSTLTLNSLGHILDYDTKDLKENFYTSSETNQKLINKNTTTGTYISGTLIMNQKSNSHSITTPQDQHLSIMPNADGAINFGKIQTNKQAIVNVTKGIKISSSQTLSSNATEGTIRFENNTFYGKKATKWVPLDLQQTMAGTLVADKVSSIDGSEIKNLNLSSDNLLPNTLLNVPKGGTGRTSFSSGRLLLGNKTLGLSEIGLYTKKAIFVRDYQSNQITQGLLEDENQGISVVSNTKQEVDTGGNTTGKTLSRLQLKHHLAPDPIPKIISLAAFETLKTIDFDTFGHLTLTSTKSIQTLYNSKNQSETKNLNKSGDIMAQTLHFDSPQIDIKTNFGNNRNLSIIPANQGLIKITNLQTSSTPKSILDIDGALTLSNIRTDSNFEPGIIYWDETNYQGFNGTTLIKLDSQLSSLGMSRTPDKTTISKTVKIEAPNDGSPALSTTGTIEASQFKGNGNNITHLNPNAFSTALAIDKGGTGRGPDYYSSMKNNKGAFILFNKPEPSKHEFNMLLLDYGKLLYGQTNANPVQVTLCCNNNNNIQVLPNLLGSPPYIQLNLANKPNLPYTLNTDSEPKLIDNININTKGLVTKISTKKLSNITYPSQNATTTFIDKTGDTLTNTLTFENTADYQIQTNQSKSLLIQASKLGIGITQPKAALHINGALQLSHKTSSYEKNGSILYDSTAGLKSRVNNEWVRLNENLGIIEWQGDTNNAYTDSTTQYIGIGTTNPQSLLHINDTLRATHFISPNGSKITHLNANNLILNEPFKIVQGGTTRTNISQDQLFISALNSQTEIYYKSLPLNQFETLKKDPGNPLNASKINALNSLSLTTTPTTLKLAHTPISVINNYTEKHNLNKQNFAILSTGINTNGHTLSVTYANISSYNILSKSKGDKKYFFKQGDTLTGKIESIRSTPNEYTIESTHHSFNISTPKNVGFGVKDPDEKLTNIGHIRIENNHPYISWKDTSSNTPKTIKMKSSDHKIHITDDTLSGLTLDFTTTHPFIGIGTPTPSSKLHIKQVGNTYQDGIGIQSLSNPIWNLYSANAHLNISKATSSPLLYFSNTAPKVGIKTAPSTSLHILQPADTYEGGMTLESTTGFKWNLFATPTGFKIKHSNIPGITLLNTNKIGIGTSQAPVGTLELSTDTLHKGLSIESATASKIWAINHHGTNGLRLELDSAPQLSILTNGKVGIGETTPTKRLHVNGSIQAHNANISQTILAPKITITQANNTDGLFIADSANFYAGTSGYGMKFETRETDTSANRSLKIGWVTANNKQIDSNDNKYIHFSNYGNIGIKKEAAPNYRLDVHKNGAISDTLIVSGHTTAPTINAEITTITGANSTTDHLLVKQNSTITDGTFHNINVTNQTTIEKDNFHVSNYTNFKDTVTITDLLKLRNVTLNTLSTFGSNSNTTFTTEGNLYANNTSEFNTTTTLKSNLNALGIVQSNRVVQKNPAKSITLNAGHLYIAPQSINTSFSNTSVPNRLTISQPISSLFTATTFASHWTKSLPYHQLQFKNKTNTQTLKLAAHHYGGGTYTNATSFVSTGVTPLLLNPHANANEGYVGIGVANPSKKLEVNGHATIQKTTQLFNTSSTHIHDTNNGNYYTHLNGQSKWKILNGLPNNSVHATSAWNGIAANSVNSAHILDGSITHAQITDGAINKFNNIKAEKFIFKTETSESIPSNGVHNGTFDGTFSNYNGNPTLWADYEFMIKKPGATAAYFNYNSYGNIHANSAHILENSASKIMTNGNLHSKSQSIYLKSDDTNKRIYYTSSSGTMTFYKSQYVLPPKTFNSEWSFGTGTQSWASILIQLSASQSVMWHGTDHWDYMSDKRLKENIQDTQISLNDIMKLNVINYNWKNDKTNKTNIGLIAQELDQVFPQWVFHNENADYLSIYYEKLGLAAVNGIQELHKETKEDIQSFINEKERTLQTTQSTLNSIEKKQADLQSKIDHILAQLDQKKTD